MRACCVRAKMLMPLCVPRSRLWCDDAKVEFQIATMMALSYIISFVILLLLLLVTTLASYRYYYRIVTV